MLFVLRDPHAPRRADNSAELCFDEFWEIVVRICNEKLPEPEERETTFEQSLESWIGLDFLPRLDAAMKKRRHAQS